MSKQRALDAINGIMPDHTPQWDFPDNPGLAEYLFDYDIWEDPLRTYVDLLKYFDIDTAHYLPGDIAEFNFPLVRYYGDATYTDDPSNDGYKRAYKPQVNKPYTSMYDSLGMSCSGSFWGMGPTLVMKDFYCKTPEEVLAFNPLEHDTHTLEERTKFFQQYYAEKQKLMGDSTLFFGWYYHTLFMWPVEIFGWENFMIASMMDPKRFEEILAQFLTLTIRDVTAMCSVESLDLIGMHDDLVSANGPMFNPDWYRKYIFPYYHEVFDIIHGAGKKLFYCICGNFMALLDDIYATGPDGIAMDVNNDLAKVTEKFTGKIIMGGGIKPDIITSGSKEDIDAMVKNIFEITKHEPGYFYQSHGMCGNTPIENVIFYQECIKKYSKK